VKAIGIITGALALVLATVALFWGVAFAAQALAELAETPCLYHFSNTQTINYCEGN
jgi:hypothetical protein